MASVVGLVPLPTRVTPPPVSRLASVEHSRVALRGDRESGPRIGEIAYTLSFMEWTLLDDLHRLAADLPATLTLDELEPQTTGTIGACVSKAAEDGMTPGPVREFIAACGTALTEPDFGSPTNGWTVSSANSTSCWTA